MKAKGRLLKQKTSKSGSNSAGKNKENVPPVARRSKDQMAKPPSLENLFVLGRQEPPSLRELGKTTYLETYPAGTPHPVPAHPPTHVHLDVHLDILHAEVDEAARTTSTPPGSPTFAQAVDTEDINASERLAEGVPIDDIYLAIFGGSSPLTTPPSSPAPAPAPRLALAYEYDPSVFGGEYSHLTSPSSSPSQSPLFSESHSDIDLLFERLAARRRVMHRQKYVWSSDEHTEESDVEEHALDTSLPPHSIRTATLLHGLALSITTSAGDTEYRLVRDVQDAEEVQPKSPRAATTSSPMPPEPAQATVQSGKGKCRAMEDLDNDNTELANATTSPHCAIPVERFEYPLIDVQTPATAATVTSSSKSFTSVNRTREAFATKLKSDATSMPSITGHPLALSESETEVVADTLIAVLMREHHNWMLLDGLLDAAKLLGHTWSEEHVITVSRSYPCLVRRETFRGVYYRYDDSVDTDFSRHWGSYFRMQKQLSVLRREI